MRRKYQRRLRHWKQQFNKDAKFIFAKPMNYAGKQYAAGAKIPKELAAQKTKLRRFWEGRVIELADFAYKSVLPDVAVRETLTLKGKKQKPKPEAEELDPWE